MKILQVRFKNLNSLVGEWAIDFSHPLFATEGIFAITGPTGAGKSTILDAICLALYGCTPRLDKISKSGNEIMARHTGECFAEAVFETPSGRFRCHWSQHRSRRSAGGELQNPKHEISDAVSGNLIQTRARGVAEEVEKITGLNYERFTRSMLLAQGEFALFLQALPDEKARLLEQITGTGIYGEISRSVHERSSQEHKKLKEMEAELAGMRLLEPDEEKELEDRLQEKQQQERLIAEDITRRNEAVQWREGVELLEKELLDLQERQQKARDAVAEFAPDYERLQLAAKAVELSPQYAELKSAETEQSADAVALEECARKLPGATTHMQQAAAASERLQSELAGRETEQAQAQPLIRKTQELDLIITGKAEPLKKARQLVEKHEHQLDAATVENNRDKQLLGKLQKELDALQKELSAMKQRERLVEEINGIEIHAGELEKCVAQCSRLDEAAELTANKYILAREECDELSAELETIELGLEDISNQITNKRQELAALLQDKAAAEWRRGQSALVEQQAVVDKTAELFMQVAQLTEEQADNEQQLLQATAEKDALMQEIQDMTKEQTALEKETGLLEQQRVLLHKIESLTEARSGLRDNEPCPLCGATTHPYALGNIPALNDTEAQLSKAKAAQRGLAAVISVMRERQAKATAVMEQAAKNVTVIEGKRARLHETVAENCAVMGDISLLKLPAADAVHKLRVLSYEISRLLKETGAILAAADILEAELRELRDSLDNERMTAREKESEYEHAQHARDAQALEKGRIAQEKTVACTRRQELLELLQAKTAGYGIEAVTAANLDRMLAQLAGMRDEWLEKNQHVNRCEQDILRLEVQTNMQSVQIAEHKRELADAAARLAIQEAELGTLQNERAGVFGDKMPALEEQRLLDAVRKAAEQLENGKAQFVAYQIEVGRLTEKAEGYKADIEKRGERIVTARTVFAARLEAFGFADEQSYLAACLERDDREKLQAVAADLNITLTEINTLEQEKRLRLDTERGKNITDDSPDELQAALANSRDAQREVQQQIGSMGQKLAYNSELKAQYREKYEKHSAQKEECSRWSALNALVGSADGKKFRNFAQGLTFELMAGYANRQLQKMTDRYILRHNPEKPLELQVVDNYQAGAVRSVKNLSGGESFVVSLALALGLSQMASRNVRVDSLFLDEGFGTLDEDALEAALETLAGLHQSGKIIGVISHVAALKERISAQITVTPKSGGRSEITGPGCRAANG